MPETEPAWRRSNRSVLLLQRRSKHNDNKWGLPGGNAEDADASLLDTAKREAAEEMGDVPDFAVTGVVETRSACPLPRESAGHDRSAWHACCKGQYMTTSCLPT